MSILVARFKGQTGTVYELRQGMYNYDIKFLYDYYIVHNTNNVAYMTHAFKKVSYSYVTALLFNRGFTRL